MSTFFITFGQQFRGEAHPFDERANPDGYFEIEAANIVAAQNRAMKVPGGHFANVYPQRPSAAHYPLGRLATIT